MKKYLLIFLILALIPFAWADDDTTVDGSSDIQVRKNSVLFQERSTNPSTPSTNKLKLFAKDKAGTTTLYTKDSAGTVTEVGAGGGGGSPGGSSGDIQVNDGASGFAGSSLFNWNSSLGILNLKGSDTVTTDTFNMYAYDGNQWGLQSYIANGTEGSESSVTSGQLAFYFQGNARIGSGYQELGGFEFVVEGTPGAAYAPGRIDIKTATASTFAATKVSIGSDGTTTFGSDGYDGGLAIYSEQGATDYTATLRTNTAMTSSANFYLPADEPVGTYLMTMTSGGVMGFDSNTYLTAITANTPLSGSGTSGSHLVIADSVADGSTKGAASFTAADFNASSGNISLDYTNGQKASGSQPGFLSSTDWSTFNGKQASGNYITALTGDVTASGAGSVTATLANIPTGVTAAGTVVFTNAAAPSSPSAGHDTIFTDSTALRFHDKNASGSIGTTVVADSGASHNFLTAISTAGAISKAQPDISDLTGFSTSGKIAQSTGSAWGASTGTWPTTLTADNALVADGTNVVIKAIGSCSSATSALTYDTTAHAFGCNSISGSGYGTIQEEGSSLTQRATANFIGAFVTAVDNSGNTRTDITVKSPFVFFHSSAGTSATRYAAPGGMLDSTSAAGAAVVPAPYACTLKNFRFRVGTSPGLAASGKAWTGNVDTCTNANPPVCSNSGITCQILETAVNCSDTSNTASLAANAHVVFEFVRVLTTNSPGNWGASVECDG